MVERGRHVQRESLAEQRPCRPVRLDASLEQPQVNMPRTHELSAILKVIVVEDIKERRRVANGLDGNLQHGL